MKRALIGCGGHAREVMAQMGKKLICFVEDEFLTKETKPMSEFDPKKYKVILKPHWSQSFKNLHPDIEIVSGKFDLSTYFELCNVLYCSAITSAVIDGVCAGVPVIQCLDPESFNLSPLRGNSEVKFVRTTQELDDALNHIGASARHISPSVLFNLDLNLSRWHQLLETKAGLTRSNYN